VTSAAAVRDPTRANGAIALLRDDVTFSMPPHSVWFRGVEAVERFLRAPPFSTRWAEGFRLVETRANGATAFAFYRYGLPSSLQVVSAVDGKISEIVSFIGVGYFRGFDLPSPLASD
jgi:RNA polymerase sigma-70 factor (ECF subfamily)